MSLTSPLYPISLQLDDRTFTEYRISVYACKPTDWHKTSTWICENNLEAYGNNKWLVQLPRIYRVFKKIGRVECFQDTLDNFFRPLFEATLRPTAEENVNVARFIANVSGFDSVDDESIADAALYITTPDDGSQSPKQWTKSYNPSYAYVMIITTKKCLRHFLSLSLSLSLPSLS